MGWSNAQIVRHLMAVYIVSKCTIMYWQSIQTALLAKAQRFWNRCSSRCDPSWACLLRQRVFHRTLVWVDVHKSLSLHSHINGLNFLHHDELLNFCPRYNVFTLKRLSASTYGYYWEVGSNTVWNASFQRGDDVCNLFGRLRSLRPSLSTQL